MRIRAGGEGSRGRVRQAGELAVAVGLAIATEELLNHAG
jgi:hypothetical protein